MNNIKGDLHFLGLGVIQQVARQVDTDYNTTGTYELIRPACEEAIKEIFPQKEIEIHPLVYVGLRVAHKLITKKDIQTVKLPSNLED